jgi:hypothetical protein
MPDFKGPGQWRKQAVEAREKALKDQNEPEDDKKD